MSLAAQIAALIVLTSDPDTQSAVVEREYVFFATINMCNEEFTEVVTIEGTMHTVSRLEKDGFYEHNIHVHGTGISTTTEYVYDQRFTNETDGIDFSQTYQVSMISKGSEPNSTLVIHNDNGVISVEFDCTNP